MGIAERITRHGLRSKEQRCTAEIFLCGHSLALRNCDEIDYGDDCIDRKVDLWIQACRDKVGRILCNRRNVSQERRTRIFREIEQVRAELMAKMRKDYYESYSEIRQFTKKVDSLGHQQRKVHAKIHELEDTCAGNVRKFRKKFGPLRVKTFRNLVISERFIFVDRRLKAKFVERIYDIDRKNMKTCAKSINTLTKM
ncbi:uncharacterized protein LOC143219024 isoform X2 [Lasioglossum baleicum]|uniref:uncharacterized protein LOC143219024 isoform X2 n=1 Tax=Lasioglossum baleicum TaxID=434251 RepID=UPI003FCE481C